MSEKLSEVEYARSHAPLLHQETYTVTLKKLNKITGQAISGSSRDILPSPVMSSRADVF